MSVHSSVRGETSTMMLCLLFLLVCSTRASHFYGTVMTYYPKSTDTSGRTQVVLRYKLNFKSCDDSDTWECFEGACGTGSPVLHVVEEESDAEWCQTEGVMTREVTSNAPFKLRLSGGNWIDNLLNKVVSWSAVTLVELRQRSDTSRANRSPQTTILPALRVPSNCPRDFNLLAFDADGDEVKCREGNAALSECVSCSLPSVLSLSSSCTLAFDSTKASTEGPYAVQIVMEDFPRQDISLTQSDGSQEVKTTSDAISKIPLQFVLRVEDEVPSCTEGLYLPKFLPPTPENRAQLFAAANQSLEINISAEANNSTISELLFSGPHAVTDTSTAVGQFRLSWTPSDSEDGQSHSVCFVVEADFNSFKLHSELRCVIVSVGDYTSSLQLTTSTTTTSTLIPTTSPSTSTTVPTTMTAPATAQPRPTLNTPPQSSTPPVPTTATTTPGATTVSTRTTAPTTTSTTPTTETTQDASLRSSDATSPTITSSNNSPSTTSTSTMTSKSPTPPTTTQPTLTSTQPATTQTTTLGTTTIPTTPTTETTQDTSPRSSDATSPTITSSTNSLLTMASKSPTLPTTTQPTLTSTQPATTQTTTLHTTTIPTTPTTKLTTTQNTSPQSFSVPMTTTTTIPSTSITTSFITTSGFSATGKPRTTVKLATSSTQSATTQVTPPLTFTSSTQFKSATPGSTTSPSTTTGTLPTNTIMSFTTQRTTKQKTTSRTSTTSTSSTQRTTYAPLTTQTLTVTQSSPVPSSMRTTASKDTTTPLNSTFNVWTQSVAYLRIGLSSVSPLTDEYIRNTVLPQIKVELVNRGLPGSSALRLVSSARLEAATTAPPAG